MDTTPWWSPVRMLIAAFFALLVPFPNVFIACLFRSKRNWASVLKIYRGWYIGMAVLALAFGLVGLIKNNSNDFCTSVLAVEGNQTSLKTFHENDSKFFDGNSVEYGKNSTPYKVYSNCIENNNLDECWSDLVGSDVSTNREAIEYQLSIGVVLHECQPKLKKPQEGIEKPIQSNIQKKLSSSENGIRQEEAKSNSDSDLGNILVVYSKESNDQFSGVTINAEAIGLLEKNIRKGMLKNYTQLLNNKGITGASIPEITSNRVSSIDALGVPVGVATVWLKSATSEGETRSKYIYVAGVIGDTLHKVICVQLNGDGIDLGVNPKCHNKLEEVFSRTN